METLPDEVLGIINGSPALLSMLYDLNLMPEQVELRDVPRVVYLAYWYQTNAGKVLNDARGI